MLAQKSNELVFNADINKTYRNAQFLIPFYKTLNEQTLLADIVPQAQIIVKQDEKYIANVAALADALEFKMSAEAARNLICEVVPREAMREENKMVDSLVKAVIKNLSPNAAA